MTKWPADKIERRAIEALIPDARNARKHSPAQIAQIAGSMKEWGWTNPVLVDEGDRIIAGHGRVLAAGRLGFTEAPVMVAEGWSEAQKRAYVIADNQLALAAEWDMDLLSSEVQGLAEWNFDLSLLGFSDLDDLLSRSGNSGRTDPDDVPPVPICPISRSGDLWVLGPHRVLCGNATTATDIARVVDGSTIDLCLTDPPYGVGEFYATHKDDGASLNGLVAAFLPQARKVSARVLLTCGNSNQHRYPAPDWTLAWFVPAGIGRSSWGFSCWQPILAYGKDPFLAKGKGGRPDALCLTESADNTLDHPCPKPVKVWSWLMERGSVNRGDHVFDPFLGSGTTLIAAEMTGRICHAVEIAPQYVDVAVRRWQDFTGNLATLDGGRTFDAIAIEREMKAA